MNSVPNHPQENLPLYSLVIVTYNQERFIRQTLQAAFAQTDLHLEIIVSDDASTDQTWAIIQETCAQYSGPHTLVLNQNKKNLGIADGAAYAMSLAKGEVIVWNDGDDLSEPHRVQTFRETFERLGKEVVLLWSPVQGIDENGQEIRQKIDLKRAMARAPRSLEEITSRSLGPELSCGGTTLAWRRELQDFFGPLPLHLLGWDHLIVFRALLQGRVECIPEPLLFYRCHGGSTTNAPDTKNLLEKYRNRVWGDRCFLQYYAQHLIDINHATLDSLSPKRLQEFIRVEYLLERLIKRQLVSLEIMSTFPHLSFRTLWKALPFPGFYRHFIYAFLYRLGLCNNK